MRVESDRPCAKGGWLHSKGAEAQLTPLPPRPRRASDTELAAIWSPVAEKYHQNGLDQLPRLAVQLGVSVASLKALRVGYAHDLQGTCCWTFPERNGSGQIVGVSRRLVDGAKRFCKGSRRALSYSLDWSKREGPVYVVEGGSDVAAGLTMGLCVVGRPNNTSGSTMLAWLLRSLRRAIIVVGERDRKSAEYVGQLTPPHSQKCRCCIRCWPGKAGMVQVAKALSGELGRSVGTAMSPAKDMRTWLNEQGIDPEDRGGCHHAGEKWKKLVRA